MIHHLTLALAVLLAQPLPGLAALPAGHWGVAWRMQRPLTASRRLESEGRCGARTVRGGWCRNRVAAGTYRCRFHP